VVSGVAVCFNRFSVLLIFFVASRLLVVEIFVLQILLRKRQEARSPDMLLHVHRRPHQMGNHMHGQLKASATHCSMALMW
jgi:hypothetical protein